MCSWHKILFPCNECKQEARIDGFMASADGEICLLLYCQTCKTKSVWRKFASQLVWDCIQLDVKEAQPLTPIRAPLKEANDDSYDEQFLREMRIGERKDEKQP